MTTAVELCTGHHSMVRRHVFIVVWIVALFFSAVIVARWVGSATGVVHAVLSYEPFHVACHLVLYAVLAAALASVAQRRVVFSGVVFVAVAVLQELAQSVATAGPPFSADAAFDLGVDAVGGAVGLALYAGATLRRRGGATRSRRRARST
jgi:hypothetical protein